MVVYHQYEVRTRNVGGGPRVRTVRLGIGAAEFWRFLRDSEAAWEREAANRTRSEGYRTPRFATSPCQALKQASTCPRQRCSRPPGDDELSVVAGLAVDRSAGLAGEVGPDQ